jgi:cell division protein FtsZ
LLDRLAAFGLSRHEETQAATPPAPRQEMAPPMAPRPAAPSQVHAEYAKRPAAPTQRPVQPEPQSRITPQVRNSEEDQLEIPAFLRRQAN